MQIVENIARFICGLNERLARDLWLASVKRKT